MNTIKILLLSFIFVFTYACGRSSNTTQVVPASAIATPATLSANSLQSMNYFNPQMAGIPTLQYPSQYNLNSFQQNGFSVLYPTYYNPWQYLYYLMASSNYGIYYGNQYYDASAYYKHMYYKYWELVRANQITYYYNAYNGNAYDVMNFYQWMRVYAGNAYYYSNANQNIYSYIDQYIRAYTQIRYYQNYINWSSQYDYTNLYQMHILQNQYYYSSYQNYYTNWYMNAYSSNRYNVYYSNYNSYPSFYLNHYSNYNYYPSNYGFNLMF